MKKIQLLILLLLITFSNGCLIHDIKAPLANNKVTVFQLNSDDYQILGVTEAEGVTKNVLFLVGWGGDGFSAIEAKVKQMGGDDFINYHIDVHSYNVLFLYNTITWKARATVIKYKDKVKK
jgi:hypothetical protein